jgi:hypothetical protein
MWNQNAVTRSSAGWNVQEDEDLIDEELDTTDGPETEHEENQYQTKEKYVDITTSKSMLLLI